MESSSALKDFLIQTDKLVPATVTALADQRKRRIQEILNSVVYVKGRANVLMKELFCPLSQAAVVIRREDGTYTDPSDFGSYIRQTRKSRHKGVFGTQVAKQ